LKLIDALKLAALPIEEGAPEKKVFLACGFTPLHLQTFLTAGLRTTFPAHQVSSKTGLFGDLCGSIERLQLQPDTYDLLIVVVEWSDLDPRLGLRMLGGWRPSQMAEIVESAARTGSRLQSGILAASRQIPTIVSLPTLPLPPMFPTIPSQTSSTEIQLRHTAMSLAASLVQEKDVRVANGQYLDEISSPDTRYDMKSDAMTGFPYSLNHAAGVAEVLCRLVDSSRQKKGLITDLDDTLWSGILGEDGHDEISWHLAQHSQLHGLYQQFLASLAGAGVLIGVASKNDSSNVEHAFERTDLLVSKSDIFPFETHWSSKSESVQRILRIWNIGPESVVFVDDSPMEVAEVKAAFPEMDCIVFPKNDYPGAWKLLRYLRELFGKPALTEEDALRLRSIRDSKVWRDARDISSKVSEDDFLESVQAHVVFEPVHSRNGARAFELLNKTNQFNLNGKRLAASDWASLFNNSGTLILAVSYTDKFGAMGKIAVIMGSVRGRVAVVTGWVISCRAFSRRIEHQCLKYLFDTFDVDEIVFDYQSTPRNTVLQEFLVELFGELPKDEVRLSRELFVAKAPRLFHNVQGVAHV
jgi:FkbH-like protein